MPFNLKNRHFLTLLDFTPQEINYLLDLSFELKKAKYAGTEQPCLTGKNIALIFEKSSTRTRCAFEVAALDQGAHVTYLGPSGSQMGDKESLRIRRGFWVACTMGSSTGVSDNRGWKNWPNLPVSRSGTA